MDDFIHRVRNGNLKRYGFDRNRNDRRKPKGGSQRKTNADHWPAIKKGLENISNNHKRLADAEERKADAMERIADCLTQFLKSSSDNKSMAPDICRD